MKRILAILLAIAMVCGVLPTLAFAEEPTEASAELITAEDDALVQADILDDINAYFDASAKRSDERTLADYVAATDDVKALVMASDTYVEGSIVERGDGFFWQTDTGITCGYFPKDRYEADQRVATRSVNTSALATWDYSSATKKDVCLVAPMYAEDSTFTNQYVNEALAIAEATGGTAYGLIDKNATVATIGQAFEKCGVVIFDSHGNTDWGYFDGGSDGTGEADCTSQANTSYLCLSSGTGMTTADCAYVTGTYGTYPHAYKSSYGDYLADGTAFANHMSGDAPDSILWMAICLGMATDGMCAPLREKGVSVVYGYSQSVSFIGDYAWEGSFWDNMIAGDTVASAISKAKNKYGEWDYSQKMYNEGVFSDSDWVVSTISAARTEYCAFPVVASDEDTYPGHGKVDNYQTVNSTWKLSSLSTPAEPITLTLNDNGTVTTQTGTSFTLPSCTAPTGYTFAGWTTAAITSEVTTKPILYAAGSTYTNESDITLYAVYTRNEGGSGSGEWKLVSDASTLAEGAQLLIASNTKGFVAGDISSSVMTNITAEFASDYATVTKPDDAVVLILGGSEGEWTLANADGQLLGATAAKKLAWDSGTTTWSITIESNDATIQNGTSTYGRFLYNVNSPRFTTYTSATNTSMLLPQLYMLDGSAGTTYYTTAPTGSSGSDDCTHDWKVTQTVAATCTVDGYTLETCSLCGATRTTNITAALGHDMKTDKVVEATCTEGGYTQLKCSRCDVTEQTNVTAALGHDMKTDKVVEATCTEGGYTQLKCSRCDATEQTNVTAALGHDMKADKVVEATCTEGGYTQLKCSRCGETEQTNVTAALGHNMVAGTAVAATCTQDGYTPYTCSRCGVTERRNVTPATGHSYEAVVTEPTYYAQGYTTHTCANCGDKYVDSYTPALKPAYNVTVRVSNEAFGKAFLSGNVVTAVPVNGMYASGFLLSPAYSATVVQEGNNFYITDVKEDCVLTIEFRSKDAAKVTFSVPAGCKAESLTGCVGETVELTAPTGKPVADAHDYVFAGWVEAPVSEALSKPDTVFTDSYLFTKQSATLYALYSYVYRGDTYYTTTVRMDTCLSEQFKDVDTSAWYHEALDFVLEYGYMNGVGEPKFEPNGLLTRAMMVTILYRLDGEGEYAAHPFKDVAKGAWYDEAVAWGYATGVVKGTSAITFSPDDYVTREQAATLLYRYAEYRGEDVSASGSLMDFEDAKQVSSYARDAMRWAVGEGIINGRSETVLEPLGTATRAEIAKILYGWLS